MRPGRTGRAPPDGTGRVGGIRLRHGSRAVCMICGIGSFGAVVVPMGSPAGAVIVADMVSSPGAASPFSTSSSPPVRARSRFLTYEYGKLFGRSPDFFQKSRNFSAASWEARRLPTGFGPETAPGDIIIWHAPLRVASGPDVQITATLREMARDSVRFFVLLGPHIAVYQVLLSLYGVDPVFPGLMRPGRSEWADRSGWGLGLEGLMAVLLAPAGLGSAAGRGCGGAGRPVGAGSTGSDRGGMRIDADRAARGRVLAAGRVPVGRIRLQGRSSGLGTPSGPALRT
jgi:hypothetical protein